MSLSAARSYGHTPQKLPRSRAISCIIAYCAHTGARLLYNRSTPKVKSFLQKNSSFFNGLRRPQSLVSVHFDGHNFFEKSCPKPAGKTAQNLPLRGGGTAKPCRRGDPISARLWRDDPGAPHRGGGVRCLLCRGDPCGRPIFTSQSASLTAPLKGEPFAGGARSLLAAFPVPPWGRRLRRSNPLLII